jgi:hypothetical protein
MTVDKVHVQARVDADLVQWFEENFSIATKQSFIENCFLYLRLSVEAGRLPTPEVYVASSAIQAAKGLNTQTLGGSDGVTASSEE